VWLSIQDAVSVRFSSAAAFLSVFSPHARDWGLETSGHNAHTPRVAVGGCGRTYRVSHRPGFSFSHSFNFSQRLVAFNSWLLLSPK